MAIKRFDVYLVNLDPTEGAEIKKTRPCIIISPNEMNNALSTVLIAPMTTTMRNYPTRVKINFMGTEGEVVLDQIRAIDKKRLVKKLGKTPQNTAPEILKILQEMFLL